MKKRLNCHHCQKSYDVPLQDINLVLNACPTQLTLVFGVYHFRNDCFFKTLARLKRTKSA